MNEQTDLSRRNFLTSVGVGMTGIALVGVAKPLSLLAQTDKEPVMESDESEEEEVSPAEDLMREHGVLKRVILIYEEAIRRIDVKSDLPPDALKDAATIIRTFIEDYHEKLEEDYLFPRFRQANTHVDLVDVLTEQHQAGRRLTDTAMQLSTAATLKDPAQSRQLADSLRRFIRMYNPHEAREDTVLFPALRKIVTPHEYGALGEDFEKREHELFGEEGFDKMVERVAGIEKQFGIYELSQFTAR